MPDRPGSTPFSAPPAAAPPPPPTMPEIDPAPTGPYRLWQCPRCGSTELGSAYLIDYSDKFRQLQLAPRALKLRKISRMLRPFKQMVSVSAQVCRHCGLVMLEVDPEDFAEAEHRYGRNERRGK